MAKITAARKAQEKKNKNILAKNAAALQPVKANKTKLRKSITPGTVLILVAGAHKGKRVVFLKQLAKSGLLLVTGPYKVNGVPVRRVNQAYVIATSTKVELPAAAVAAVEKVDDAFFATMKADAAKVVAAAEKAATKDGKKFIAAEAKAEVKVDAKRVALQKTVDAALLPAVQKLGKDFVKYLAATFSLSKAQYPHLLKF